MCTLCGSSQGVASFARISRDLSCPLRSITRVTPARRFGPVQTGLRPSNVSLLVHKQRRASRPHAESEAQSRDSQQPASPAVSHAQKAPTQQALAMHSSNSSIMAQLAPLFAHCLAHLVALTPTAFAPWQSERTPKYKAQSKALSGNTRACAENRFGWDQTLALLSCSAWSWHLLLACTNRFKHCIAPAFYIAPAFTQIRSAQHTPSLPARQASLAPARRTSPPPGASHESDLRAPATLANHQVSK